MSTDRPTSSSATDQHGHQGPRTRTDGPLPHLTQLLLVTASLDEFLTDLATFAVNELDPAASCGITLQQPHGPLTVSSSDQLALAVDELQYERDTGPCLQALRGGQVVIVADTATEARWDDYGAHALAYGVRSSMSVPLTAAGLVVGAMNVYSDQTHAFDDPESITSGQSLATQADAVLGIALRLGQQTVLTEQLREAMAHRSIIDQAVGILMTQQRCSSAEAFDILRKTSNQRNRKLRDVAADLVTAISGEAVTPSPFTDRTRNQ